MKFLALTDHFVRKEHYEELFANYPEHTLATVFYGEEDRIIMRDMFREVEVNGPDAVEIPQAVYDEAVDADVIITHLCPVPAKLIEKAPKLRAILSNRGGLENIAVKAATERNIPILNNPAHNANAVAEFTVALMIAEARNMVRSYYSVKHGDWRENYSNFGNIWEIRGKTVGLIGFSTIGRLVAEKLSSFGVKMLVSDPKCDPEDELVKRLGIKVVDLTTLMKESDYVSLHARASGCFLTKDVLSLMKPTAIFVNTARGPIVDSQALADALNEGKIRAAGIDVYEMEPPIPSDHPLVNAKNALLAPHVAFATKEAMERRAEIVFENMYAWLGGEVLNKIC